MTAGEGLWGTSRDRNLVLIEELRAANVVPIDGQYVFWSVSLTSYYLNEISEFVDREPP